eukprot:GHVQ01038819.1.p1 GENE.GHVQ01038819.1~~GHVQ01038819.1.p1  ORF type:complete len:297 (-),score=10.52 GHVQ01038819.1:83-973(-)
MEIKKTIKHCLCKKRWNPRFHLLRLGSSCGSGYPICHLPNYPSVFQYMDGFEADFQKRLKNGDLEPVPLPPYIISPMNVLKQTKADGSTKTRIVVDFTASGLNSCLAAPPYTNPTIDDIIRTIYPFDYIIKIDIADAFASLPMHPKFADLLGIQHPVTKQFFRFRTGSFGMRSLPWLFWHSMTAVHYALAQTDIYKFATAVTNFVEDFIIIAKSPTNAKRTADIFCNTLTHLGWKINENKTEGPAQVLQDIGLIIDTQRQLITIHKQNNIKYCSSTNYSKWQVNPTNNLLYGTSPR